MLKRGSSMLAYQIGGRRRQLQYMVAVKYLPNSCTCKNTLDSNREGVMHGSTTRERHSKYHSHREPDCTGRFAQDWDDTHNNPRSE